jgi:hypothetical protein
MSTLSPRQSALPADWGDVLESIERALAQVLADATDRERALQFVTAVPEPAAQTLPAEAGLAKLDERLRGFPVGLQQAEQEVAALDADLHAGQEQIQNWLTAAEGIRQKLARWDTPSIK